MQPLLTTVYRVQPTGLPLAGHTSGLASERVAGIFAFEAASQAAAVEALKDTYTWLHVRRQLASYELLTFTAVVVDRPADSEGVVVTPVDILTRTPMQEIVS